MHCAMCLGLLCSWESLCPPASSASIEIFNKRFSTTQILYLLVAYLHRHRIDFYMPCVSCFVVFVLAFSSGWVEL